MTQPPTKPPTNLQPRLKAAPTFNTSSQTASGSSTPIPRSQSHGVPRAPSYASRDFTSDSATSALVRRTLCARQGHMIKGDGNNGATRPLHELLPPLTSSNDVDLQLYAFIAIIIRDYVYAWYAKITPDQEFVDQVLQTIAHCTRAIEQRLKSVDLELLLLDEIPALFEAHILAYRTSFQVLHPPPLTSNPLEIYHAIHPHPALSPVLDPSSPQTIADQAKNEADYRHLLVQKALTILLPTDDLENDSLRALVGEIFAELILGNAIGSKGSEGWLWWEGITKGVELLREQVSQATPGDFESSKIGNIPDKVQSIRKPEKVGLRPVSSILSSASRLFARYIQYLFVAFSMLRFVIANLANSGALSARVLYPSTSRTVRSSPSGSLQDDSANNLPPLIDLSIFSASSRLLSVPVRVPWIYGCIIWIQHMLLRGPFRLGATNSALDRLIHNALLRPLLSPSRLPTLLVAIRSSLFPGNHLGPSRAALPSSAEKEAIRRRCAQSIVSILPVGLTSVYFGTTHELEKIAAVEHQILDVLAQPYCLKHFLWAVVELVLVRVFPELAEEEEKEGVESSMENEKGV